MAENVSSDSCAKASGILRMMESASDDCNIESQSQFLQKDFFGFWQKVFPFILMNGIKYDYFCIVNTKGFYNKNKKDLLYPNLPSALRPVPHENDIPVPIPIDIEEVLPNDESIIKHELISREQESNKLRSNFKEMLSAFQKLGCRMNLKIYFLFSHSEYFPKSLGDYSEEIGGRFHQDFKTIKIRYLRRYNGNMMVDYCWMLIRENLTAKI
ncbi:hypothetical protein HELRODRAFT_173200 [Helobdella robusta]|uniref:Uncharacterized protein n=1 Tax=Helobdella robusta TaxID=6412 RepID=T1F6J8_HELRO|nr:hypothetical protein HELRODRAFT_173200 [Helobdella robusta]ESO04112.1 hypothetical protein HELRODRAFT_173200 [Helobdella robusta]